MAILAITLINMMLTATSGWLTRFEKHHTRSSEACSLAHQLFLAQVWAPLPRSARPKP